MRKTYENSTYRNQNYETTESYSSAGFMINFQRLRSCLTLQNPDALELCWKLLGGFSGNVETAVLNPTEKIINKNRKFDSVGSGIVINPDMIVGFRDYYLRKVFDILEIKITKKEERNVYSIEYLKRFFKDFLIRIPAMFGEGILWQARDDAYRTVRNEIYKVNEESDLINYFGIPFVKFLDEIKTEYEKDKSEKNKFKLLGISLNGIEEIIKCNITAIWVHEFAHGMDDKIIKPKSLQESLIQVCKKMISISNLTFNLAVIQTLTFVALSFVPIDFSQSVNNMVEKLGDPQIGGAIIRGETILAVGFLIASSWLGYKATKKNTYFSEKFAIYYEEKVVKEKISFKDCVRINREEFWELGDKSERSYILNRGFGMLSMD